MTRRVTIYSQFVDEWALCKLCPSHTGRSKVVQFRGKIPCDVAFVGQAPGEGEDTNGRPFEKGAPAGKLLEYMVKQSIPPGVRVGFMNLVGCIPRDEDGRETAPSDESITACQPRLQRLLEICKPKIVVAVGKPAKDYLEQGYRHSVKLPKGVVVVNIIHPSGIIRSNTAQQGYLVQRSCVVISNAVQDLLESTDGEEGHKAGRGIDFRKHLKRPKA